jgi:uncharacterized membrane protein YeaQ/YmgE (transglycosylase-associated protein family)
MAVESRVVVGEVASVHAARQTFLALQNSGVDEGDIKLAGDAAVEAQHTGDDPEGKERIDEAVVRRGFSHVVVNGLLGGIAGVVVGAVGGALAVLIVDGEWWWVFIPVFVLGVLGAVVGAFIGAERNIGVDDELELTLSDVAGPMWIAVRVRDDDAARAIGDVFSAQGIDTIEEHTAKSRGLHLIEW